MERSLESGIMAANEKPNKVEPPVQAGSGLEHETAFVKTFIARAKWARYLQLLGNRRRRGEILARLDHKLDYLPALAMNVPEDQDYPAALERLLQARGAGPTCHVLVNGLRIDGCELPLREALDAICLHANGSILSCVPGRLAYYRPEAPGGGVLLVRDPPPGGAGPGD